MNLSRDEAGLYLGHNGGETLNVHDQLHQIWRGMAEEGLISQKQYQQGTVLNFYKSPEEFMAPLKDESSAAYRNGLRLVDERTEATVCSTSIVGITAQPLLPAEQPQPAAEPPPAGLPPPPSGTIGGRTATEATS